MTFNLLGDLLKAHESLKDGNQTLLTDYLLTLPDGTTFNIMGGFKIQNSRIKREDEQAIMRYRKAEDVRRLQFLPEDTLVLLNGKQMPLERIYNFIGRNYLPRLRYIGVDDSDEVIRELLIGRRGLE